MTSFLLIPKYENITFKPALTVLVQVAHPRSLIDITKFWMDLGGDEQKGRKAKTSLGMSPLSGWLVPPNGAPDWLPRSALLPPVGARPASCGYWSRPDQKAFIRSPALRLQFCLGGYDTLPHKHSAADD